MGGKRMMEKAWENLNRVFGWTKSMSGILFRKLYAYEGDETFLEKATPRTQRLMKKLNNLLMIEQQMGGVFDIDTQTVMSLVTYKPGYLDKDEESSSDFRPTSRLSAVLILLAVCA